MTTASTPKSEFTKMDSARTMLLARCEQYAGWTIPSKFPPKEANDNYEMSIDFQAVGAKCVNNLVNKMILALFAPSRPFFRPELSEKDIASLAENGLEGAALDAVLSQVAKQGMKRLEAMQVRPVLTETVLQLIITGNGLLFHDKKEKALALFTLRDYVVRRNAKGQVRRIIVRETTELGSMSVDVQKAYRTRNQNALDDRVVSLYTQLDWDSARKVWRQTQSIEDIDVTKGVTQYKQRDMPWRVLVWSLAPKRNYGTGMVEEAQGAFHGLSTLSSAEVPGLLEMCRIIHLADPTGSTDAAEFQNALSGAVLVGRPNDITTPDMGGKARDYQSVAGKIERYERLLSEMFLLATSAVRNADRVTAEEIRLIANELEASKGGVYSRLSFELQQWLAEIAIEEIQNDSLRKMDVYVITGMDALSANGDLDNLRAMMADLANTQNLPDELKGTIVWDSYVQLVASLHNVDYFKFLKSQAAMQQEQAAEAEAAAAAQQEQVATEAMGEVAVNALAESEA